MNYLSRKIVNLNEKLVILYIDFKHLSNSNLNFHWGLNFRRLSRNRLGQCDCNNKLIELNIDYIEIRPLDDFQDTLRHEIAHAVVFEKYYHNNWENIKPHGKEWQEIAQNLEAIPKRCSKKSKERPKLNYWLECTIHGVVNSWIYKPSWFENELISEKPSNSINCEICKMDGISNRLELNRRT